MIKLGKIKFLIFSSVLFLALISGLAQIRAASWEYQIDSVTPSDESGAPKSTFARGELVVAKTTVTNIMSYTYAAEPFLMIAKIERGGTMWGYGSFGFSLLSGQSVSANPGILIPSNAPTGTYTLTVYVWSNWATAGGYPIAAQYQVTITVT